MTIQPITNDAIEGAEDATAALLVHTAQQWAR